MSPPTPLPPVAVGTSSSAFRHLPTEIIELIFIQLPDPHTYLRLSTISRRFRSIAVSKYIRRKFSSQWFESNCDDTQWEQPAVCIHRDYFEEWKYPLRPKGSWEVPNIVGKLDTQGLFYNNGSGYGNSRWGCLSGWSTSKRENYMTKVLPRRLGRSKKPLEELVMDIEDVVMGWDMVRTWERVPIEDRDSDDGNANRTVIAFRYWEQREGYHGCLCGRNVEFYYERSQSRLTKRARELYDEVDCAESGRDLKKRNLQEKQY
ncbi:hypothetical protein BJ508DRAFT_334797 [Ascobolus immersus RN42]|uniref:F-box domain-containing protein n=1 Tax=Ascobolus immersus RN42 TaxID=1160509 RepID=A0A3N4HGM9_ASCIM|nr:hypothetical protein BJ508DRAFT_334797 [Ascobolus immersus RN42]